MYIKLLSIICTIFSVTEHAGLAGASRVMPIARDEAPEVVQDAVCPWCRSRGLQESEDLCERRHRAIMGVDVV